MPIIQTNQVNLLQTAQNLKQSLSQIAPDNSQMTKVITFALVSTALVGMFVYHYIKTQEDSS